MTICARCGEHIEWVAIDNNDDGWWEHEVQPADDHEAMKRGQFISEFRFPVRIIGPE